MKQSEGLSKGHGGLGTLSVYMYHCFCIQVLERDSTAVSGKVLGMFRIEMPIWTELTAFVGELGLSNNITFNVILSSLLQSQGTKKSTEDHYQRMPTPPPYITVPGSANSP